MLARDFSHVKPGFRRVRYVRHYIYFKSADEGVYVERILHDAMDETLHII